MRARARALCAQARVWLCVMASVISRCVAGSAFNVCQRCAATCRRCTVGRAGREQRRGQQQCAGKELSYAYQASAVGCGYGYTCRSGAIGRALITLVTSASSRAAAAIAAARNPVLACSSCARSRLAARYACMQAGRQVGEASGAMVTLATQSMGRRASSAASAALAACRSSSR